MHYDTALRDHGMRHDPFKALAVPRPIGWIGTLAADGTPNLAPYSFFNAVSDRPPMVIFSSAGRKDSLANVEATGEFTCSLATWALRDAMNRSSAPFAPEVDEFAAAGLTAAPSRFVRAPRVGESPAAFECRLWRIVELPHDATHPEHTHWVVFGQVVGVYIDDACIRDGRVDIGAIRPLARMGYMDYSFVTPETMFTMNRPQVSADGRSAVVDEAPWDGTYR